MLAMPGGPGVAVVAAGGNDVVGAVGRVPVGALGVAASLEGRSF